MPVATSVPAQNVVLRFPGSTQANDYDSEGEVEAENYQLLELPAEILKAVESSSKPLSLTIKGKPSDDAVLCTPTSTCLLRTVQISNSLLVCRPPALSGSSSSRPTLEIRDISHEILECVPQAANLDRIRGVLKDAAWKGMGTDLMLGKRKREAESGPRRWTRAQLESVIQGSDEELGRGLRERNVVEVDGHMLLLPAIHLVPLLSILLTLLTIHATSVTMPTATAPTLALVSGMEDQDISPALSTAVLGLFGRVIGDSWTGDVRRIVTEIGKGLLEGLKGVAEGSDVFLDRWMEQVGEMWLELVDLKLLEGEYLLNAPPPHSLSTSSLIQPFALHSLPLHPPTRFSDLFLTRAKWRPDDMIPFLRGLYRDGDAKERDKLVVKFVRVVKEKDGVWWFPRRTA